MSTGVASIEPARHRLLKPPFSLRQGLVAYWPLATAGAVDLKSTLYDGRGPYDLTNNNSVTRGAGPSNNLPDAASFAAASSQYFSRASDVNLGLSQGGTFVVWAFITTDVNMGLCNKYLGTGDQREFTVQHSATGNDFVLSTSADGASTLVNVRSDGGPAIGQNTWYMVTFGYDFVGKRQFIKVNLNPTTYTAQTAIFTGSAAFQIGSAFNTSTFWDGRQSQMGKWDRLLTDDELFWLYNNGQGRDLVRGV